MKPRMFIGSSSEGLGLAYAVQSNLQSTSEVTVWDQGAIKPSTTVLESLLDYLNDSDFALFIFNPDDVINIRGEETASVRDNVLLELGLFTGRLGKERCFILTPEGSDIRTPTDLLGITRLTSESARTDKNLVAATGPACHQIKEVISRLGRRTETSSPPTAGGEAQEVKATIAAQQRATKTIDVGASTSEEKDPKYQWLYAYLDKEYERSIELLRARIADEPDEDEKIDLEAWVGRILYQINQPEGEAYLEKLIAEHGALSAPYLHLANIRRLEQRYLDALSIVERGLDSVHADLSLLLANKANILLEVGRGEEAQIMLRQGLAKYPDRPDFYNQLSDYLRGAGENEEARRILELGVHTVADRESIIARLAGILYEGSEREVSLIWYSYLIDLKPDNPAYLTLRGNIFLDLGMYDTAMRDYKAADELAGSKQGWILANIGNFYKSQGLYREGISYLQRALSLEPESSYAHERLAQAIKSRDEEERKFGEIIRRARPKLAESKRKAASGENVQDPPNSQLN